MLFAVVVPARKRCFRVHWGVDRFVEKALRNFLSKFAQLSKFAEQQMPDGLTSHRICRFASWQLSRLNDFSIFLGFAVRATRANSIVTKDFLYKNVTMT
jgi:hypothetical protein